MSTTNVPQPALPPKPRALSVRPENIPDELKRWPQWVVWRYEPNPKNATWDKPPRQVRLGGLASSTDRRTWATYEDALAAYQDPDRHWDGIGFCPSTEDPFVFGDFDHCLQDRKLDPEVVHLLRETPSYAELSPSGTGVRLILKGRLPSQGKNGSIEVYDRARYHTITGHRFPSAPTTISNRPQHVAALYALFLQHKTAEKGLAPGTTAGDRIYRPGQRGGRIRELFGRLNSEGLSPDTILAAVLEENTRHFDPPKAEDELRAEVAEQWKRYHHQNGQGPAAREPAEPAPPPAPRSALADVEAIWTAWMATGRDGGADPYPLRVVLGVYGGNRLEGEPIWAMIVGSSGGGKTEVVRAIEGSEHVAFVSDLTGPAALLSGTPKKSRSSGANGGLLQALGEFGVLALKDFTTILEMHREKRAEILAALREIHDGAWYRDTGTDGGMRLSWQGKLGLVAGCTTAIDANHGVMAEMGPRFLLARLPDVDRRTQGCRAVRQSSREKTERERLRLAVRGLFENLPDEPPELDDDTVERIVDIADLVALARSPVQRDYRGELELVHDPEAPTRISKQLAQLYRGLLWIGLDDHAAWQTVARVAVDSIPKLRGLVLRSLIDLDQPAPTSRIAGIVDHPTMSTRRALEELDAHHVVDRLGDEGQGRTYTWTLTREARAVWLRTFSEMSSSTGSSSLEEAAERWIRSSPEGGSDKSEKVPSAAGDDIADLESSFDDLPAGI